MQCWINGSATSRIDGNIKMAIILLKTNIPAFSPRRRLYEPEAIIPLFHFWGKFGNPKKALSSVSFSIRLTVFLAGGGALSLGPYAPCPFFPPSRRGVSVNPYGPEAEFQIPHSIASVFCFLMPVFCLLISAL